LQEWFRKALDHRDFALVKQYTHTVHGILQMQMPLDPALQLDTPMAAHDSLACRASRAAWMGWGCSRMWSAGGEDNFR